MHINMRKELHFLFDVSLIVLYKVPGPSGKQGESRPVQVSSVRMSKRPLDEAA